MTEQIPNGYDGQDGEKYNGLDKYREAKYAHKIHVYAVTLVAWTVMGCVGSNGLDQFRDSPPKTQDLFLFPNGKPKQDEEGLYSPRLWPSQKILSCRSSTMTKAG